MCEGGGRGGKKGGRAFYYTHRRGQASERAVCVCVAVSVEKGARRPPLLAAVVCGGGLAALPQPSQCRPETGLANISKSGRDGQRGAAAQHKHYGAVHRDAGQPRAMPASSAPPGACSARSSAPHALSSEGVLDIGAKRRVGQFPPKKNQVLVNFAN